MERTAEEILREEWDLLKTSGLLSQISSSAGPVKISRGVYNMFKWNALIKAPKNSPYNGYMFKFEITYPENYPHNPPTVKCLNKIYHMNIREKDGDVCVSSIKDTSSPNGWASAKDISTVLKSIFIIFKRPFPGSPYRRDLAELYNKDIKQYEKNVKEYCEKFAIKAE